jgi:hypothetical protein
MPNFARNMASPPVLPAIGAPLYADTTGPITPAADAMRAMHVGRFDYALASVGACFYVHGVAAAGAGWAEIAVGHSAPGSLQAATIPITLAGYASIDAEVKTASTVQYVKTISGLSIPAGRDVWVIVVCNYATTQASYRGWVGTDAQGRVRYCAGGGRPSTQLGTSKNFTHPGNGLGGQAGPALWAENFVAR